MRQLAENFTAEVDTVDKDSWYAIINNFDDANIYQTWSYDAVRCVSDNISHLTLKRNGTIVAAAQARIVKIPLINTGIAYIRWGPMWRLRETPVNIEVFCQAIRALRNEYVCRRGLILRLFPILFNDSFDTFIPLFEHEGFVRLAKARRERTLLIDLSTSLDDLHRDLKQSWRRQLNRARRNDLEIIQGYDDDLFEMFMDMYREMVDRKDYFRSPDLNEFRSMQKTLPKNLKMKIMICKSNGNLCAGLICSAIGKTAIYLFGATSNIGLESRGSYLLHWKLIEWLKSSGFFWYDLNGINPEANPGTYRFKAGLCGKNGKDVQFLGQFDAYKGLLSLFSVRCGDMLISNYRKTKEIIYNWPYSKD